MVENPIFELEDADKYPILYPFHSAIQFAPPRQYPDGYAVRAKSPKMMR